MPITNQSAIAAETGLQESEIPATLYDGPFENAYLQMTDSDTGRAYSSIFFYPPQTAFTFNSLLFKDFGLGGECVCACKLACMLSRKQDVDGSNERDIAVDRPSDRTRDIPTVTQVWRAATTSSS